MVINLDLKNQIGFFFKLSFFERTSQGFKNLENKPLVQFSQIC
jgi:hypothetical protein